MKALIRWGSLLHVSVDSAVRQFVKEEAWDSAWAVWSELIEERAELLELNRYLATLPAVSPQKQDSESFTEYDAFRMIATVGNLALNIQKMGPGEWLETLETLLKVAQDANAISIEDQPLLHQLLAGELAWLLGTVFFDLKPARSVCAMSRRALSEGLSDILDGGGLPKANNLHLLRPLLACWTRVLDLGVIAGTPPWRISPQKQYEWAILQSLRFTRKDGSAVFSDLRSDNFASGNGRISKAAYLETLEMALCLDSDKTDRKIARTVFPTKKSLEGKAKKPVDPKKLPDATYLSEWAGLAMMRSGWTHDEPGLAVSYGAIENGESGNRRTADPTEPFGGWTDRTVRFEWNCKNRTLWSGSWDLLVRRDGRKLSPIDSWSEICNMHEDTHSYLELELPLEEKCIVQRHILFFHAEKLMMLADSVLFPLSAPESVPVRIEYESAITPGAQIAAVHDPEATEILLTVRRSSQDSPIARILPLALPEWKNLDFDGEFLLEGGSLRYRVHSEGKSLFAPLIVDWDSARMRKPFTWRHLTVGENLEMVPKDRAAGFRVQLGNKQYLLYRSLTSIANRTVLGHNLVSDLLFARFDPAQGVIPVLEVEETP